VELTAGAPEVRLPGSMPSAWAVPFRHPAAWKPVVVVSAWPTIRPELLTAIGSTSTPPLGSAGSLVTVLPLIVKPTSPWLEPNPVIRPLSLMEVKAGLLTRFWSPSCAPRSVGVALSGHSTAVWLPVANDVAEPTMSALPLIASGADWELAFA